MQIVYVIQHSITKQLYVGQTINLQQRLKAHNANQTKSTRRKNGEWIFVYAEAYKSKQDALHREKMLKHHGSSKRELLKRIANSLIETKSEAG